METHQIHDRIRSVLRALDVLRVDAYDLADGDDLYDAGLRSLGAVRLLVALEGEFGVEFPESALHGGAFTTIERIGETLGAVAAGGGARAGNRG